MDIMKSDAYAIAKYIKEAEKQTPVKAYINGDFSQGDTGFITGYTFVADPNPFGVQSSYSIVTNPNAWFTAFAACGDHTTGNGNMVASV